MTEIDQVPQPGSIVRGRVLRLLENGAIIDIGRGIKGCIDRDKITWRNRRPTIANVLKVGDEFDVVVTKVRRSEKTRTIFISLDALQCQPNPWPFLQGDLPVGSTAKATIVGLLPFGLEVEMEEGFHGLVHASELSWMETEPHIKNRFRIGDVLDVVIQRIDPEKRRIYASHRLSLEDPWAKCEMSWPLGSRRRGKVVEFRSSGARIELDDGIYAFLPNAEVSWTDHNLCAADVFQLGASLDVVVARLDKNKRRIYVSYRKAVENPFIAFRDQFPCGSNLTGTVVAVLHYGARVRLPGGLDGLLHNKERP